MSAGPHRYWRIVDLSIPGGGFLEVSELHLYAGASKITATLSSSVAPAFNTVSTLDDNAGATRCYWAEATAEDPSFWIKWDVGAGNDIEVDGIRQAGFDTATRYASGCTLQWSDNDSTWSTAGYVSGIPYPGNTTYGSVYTFTGIGSSGTAASTQVKDVGAATGGVRASGTLTRTQTKNVGAAAGAVKISGTAPGAQAKNISTTAGAVKVSGTQARAQALNVGDADGAVRVSGVSASTQGLNAAAAAGSSGTSFVGASTQAKNVGAAVGGVRVSGSSARTQAMNVAAGSGFTGTAGATRLVFGAQLLPNFVQPHAADARTMFIGAQVRSLAFAQDRSYPVIGQARSAVLDAESRVFAARGESRVDVP